MTKHEIEAADTVDVAEELTVSIGTHLWVHWLEICFSHERAAEEARQRIDRLPVGGEFIEAQTDEMQASMVAITGAAAALDAFYGEVRPRVKLPEGLECAWRKDSGPKRPMQILETLKHGFSVGKLAAAWPDPLRELYRLRDPMIHHRLQPHPAVDHPSGRSKVGRESADYVVENARMAIDLVLEIISAVIESAPPEHREWAEGHSRLLADLKDSRKAMRI